MNLNNSVTHCVAADTKGSLSLSLCLKLEYVITHTLSHGFSYSNAHLLLAGMLLISWRYYSFSSLNVHLLLAGIKYQAAKLRGDIIHYCWLLDCCSQKKLLHLQPKLVMLFDQLHISGTSYKVYNPLYCFLLRYFLFLSDSSKKLLKEIDEFSDSYYQDIDLADIKQVY